VPIVFIDADHPGLTEAHRIVVDDAAGGRLATEHLIRLGHTRIGFIGNPIESPFYFHPIRDRYRGYRKAHADARLPLRPEYHLEDEYGRPQARRMAETLFALKEPPTAIVAASDTLAFGVLEAARSAGRRVPEDLSVIGFDDVEMAGSGRAHDDSAAPLRVGEARDGAAPRLLRAPSGVGAEVPADRARDPKTTLSFAPTTSRMNPRSRSASTGLGLLDPDHWDPCCRGHPSPALLTCF
jgi:hypothetical protein